MPSASVEVVRAIYQRPERGVRREYYWERADALEAAGINEQAIDGRRGIVSSAARTRGARAIAAMSNST